MEQPQLFCQEPDLPAGMTYQHAFLSTTEEDGLLATLRALPFSEARYREWTARRRIVSYGGRYDFSSNRLLAGEPMPELFHPLRDRIAGWCGIPAAAFSHLLIAEYAPGTQLGWHRDVPDFDTVVGVSLAGTARMRLRPYPPREGHGRATRSIDIEPRSIYILSGPARWNWQHAISPTKSLRYSLTFRTLAP